MFVLVPLDRIQMNPWQPRQSHDEAHIAALAADIQARYATKPDTLGLLQLPAGRIVGADGRTPVTIEGRRGINFSIALVAQDAWVQLAYGHSRFAAFCVLAKMDKRFAKVPVELIAWNDEEMATSAWSENEARSALNPFEKAVALQRYMHDFGWTQQQLAERLKLDRSTVANKVRLLKLPEQARQQLATGVLSERQATALLPLADLPPDVLARAEATYSKPSELLRDAPTRSSEDLRERVGAIIRTATYNLQQAPFPTDQDTGAGNVVSPTCTNCPQRIVRGSDERRCPVKDCYDTKTHAWSQAQAAAASAATGLPIAADPLPYDTYTSFYSLNAADQQAAASGCEKLHVHFTSNTGSSRVRSEGFPSCEIVCVHGARKKCTCALRAQKEVAAADPEEQRKQAGKQESRALLEPAISAVQQALQDGNLDVWRVLAELAVYRDRDTAAKRDLDGVQRIIAQALVERSLSDWKLDDPAYVREHVIKTMGAFGLSLPWAEQGAVEELERKLARIEGWIERLATEQPTVPQLRGNMGNLTDLQADIVKLPNAGALLHLQQRIQAAQHTLRVVAPIVHDGPIEDMEHVRPLLNGSAGDDNYEFAVVRASSPALRYAWALMDAREGNKSRQAAITRELRARDETMHVGAQTYDALVGV